MIINMRFGDMMNVKQLVNNIEIRSHIKYWKLDINVSLLVMRILVLQVSSYVDSSFGTRKSSFISKQK